VIHEQVASIQIDDFLKTDRVNVSDWACGSMENRHKESQPTIPQLNEWPSLARFLIAAVRVA
jgi:hypothetical protein